MKKLRIYLDTSVISFLYADDVPELQQITRSFFEEYVKNNVYIVYVSDVVLKEIGKTRSVALRKSLLSSIKDYKLRILRLTDESEGLAGIYINEQIIAKNKADDARHIAIATRWTSFYPGISGTSQTIISKGACGLSMKNMDINTRWN